MTRSWPGRSARQTATAAAGSRSCSHGDRGAGQGVGRALLRDAFGKFRDRGEPSAGLSVDAENTTGAFHLYESAGMRPVLGWVMYEKAIGD